MVTTSRKIESLEREYCTSPESCDHTTLPSFEVMRSYMVCCSAASVEPLSTFKESSKVSDGWTFSHRCRPEMTSWTVVSALRRAGPCDYGHPKFQVRIAPFWLYQSKIYRDRTPVCP